VLRDSTGVARGLEIGAGMSPRTESRPLTACPTWALAMPGVPLGHPQISVSKLAGDHVQLGPRWRATLRRCASNREGDIHDHRGLHKHGERPYARFGVTSGKSLSSGSPCGMDASTFCANTLRCTPWDRHCWTWEQDAASLNAVPSARQQLPTPHTGTVSNAKMGRMASGAVSARGGLLRVRC